MLMRRHLLWLSFLYHIIFETKSRKQLIKEFLRVKELNTWCSIPVTTSVPTVVLGFSKRHLADLRHAESVKVVVFSIVEKVVDQKVLEILCAHATVWTLIGSIELEDLTLVLKLSSLGAVNDLNPERILRVTLLTFIEVDRH